MGQTPGRDFSDERLGESSAVAESLQRHLPTNKDSIMASSDAKRVLFIGQQPETVDFSDRRSRRLRRRQNPCRYRDRHAADGRTRLACRPLPSRRSVGSGTASTGHRYPTIAAYWPSPEAACGRLASTPRMRSDVKAFEQVMAVLAVGGSGLDGVQRQQGYVVAAHGDAEVQPAILGNLDGAIHFRLIPGQ
jgi:hypothetical protein